jgi:O-antigen/teichoic acid export membrane protein
VGVIARQTLKSSTVGYIAAVVGTINTFFIYTLCFDAAELGRFRYVQEAGMVLAGFFSLGITNVIVRFFPDFRDNKSKHHGFLGFIMVVLLGGVLVFLCLYWLTFQWWPSEFQDNFWYIFLLFIAIMFTNSFYYYSSNFRLITVPNIFRNLWVKIGLGLSALIYFYFRLSYDSILYIVVFVYMVAMFGVLFYLHLKRNFSFNIEFKYFTKNRIKNIAVFAGFGLLTSLGSSLATRLDIFMVTDMLSFSKTGVYSIAMSLTGLMVLVTSPMLSISGPILADSIAKNNINHILDIYKKSSLNLFLFGTLFLLVIWVNIDSIFQIIPNGEKYTEGKIVILILGLAKLADMVTSVNGLIIGYSKYFRFNLYALLLLGVLNILANLFFIPLFDIAGAALATFLSITLYNLAKTVFIYKKFAIHPFQKSLGHIFLLTLGTFFLVDYLVQINNPYMSILLKSMLVLIVYVSISLRLNFSEDITHLWVKIKNKIFTIIK